MKSNKEILLEWIDINLPSYYHLTQSNFEQYLGDTAELFVRLTEYKIRKKILEFYLESPKEETILNVLQDIQTDYRSDGYSQAEYRALNRVLVRFNQPLFIQ